MKNALFVLALTCSISYAQDVVKTPDPKAQADKPKASSGNPTPPVNSKKPETQPDPAKSGPKKESDHPPEEISAWIANYWAAWIAFGALLLGIGQVIYIGRQLHVMARTLEANKVAADAAAASSESYMRSEAPHFFVAVNEIRLMPPKHSEILPDGKWNVTPALDFYFKNFGRTPGIIVGCRIEIQMHETLPESPSFTDRSTHRIGENVVGPNAAEIAEITRYKDRLTEKERLAIIANTAKFYFIGYLHYKDLFENYHRYGFCLQYNENIQGLHTTGGTAYNYRRIERIHATIEERQKKWRFSLVRWPIFRA